ncbi:MAG: dehydrogenase [Halioglobus sp.]|nr:dehydrogenase [Halioglobus sp.]
MHGDKQNVFINLTRCLLLGVALCAPAAATAAPAAGTATGDQLFQQHCYTCHNGGTPKAPRLDTLMQMPREAIYAAITSGIMSSQASALSAEERAVLADFLGVSADRERPAKPACNAPPGWLDTGSTLRVEHWGMSADGRRFIPPAVAGLAREELPQLALEWAFAYPDAVRARSQPAVLGSALFVGSQGGQVYAIDSSSGCVHWQYQADAEVRVAITLGEGDAAHLLFFADTAARVYALDARSGTLVWSTVVDSHSNATVTGSPIFYLQAGRARLYVPVSTTEDNETPDPQYSCCTFRGSVVALDALSGEREWKTHTIARTPTVHHRNPRGVPQLGPSGASVWNQPIVDAKRGLLLFGTGQNHSSPADDNSDAVFALDLASGKVVWKTQLTQNDAWNSSCLSPPGARFNCPEEDGPDFDIGASPVLVSQGERAILVVGQKSGDVYGMDPDTGEVRWKRTLARGGLSGGVHFSLAADGDTVYVPIDDYDNYLPYPPDRYDHRGEQRPGVYAVHAFSGETRWFRSARDACDGADCGGFSAAITAIDGAVLACARYGRCFAFDRDSGATLWSYDTAREFDSISGQTAQGGNVDGPGPVVAGGRVFINSGYSFYTGAAGNVLLSFRPVTGSGNTRK